MEQKEQRKKRKSKLNGIGKGWVGGVGKYRPWTTTMYWSFPSSSSSSSFSSSSSSFGALQYGNVVNGKDFLVPNSQL